MNILKAISRTFRFDRTSWKKLMFCFLVSCVFWVINKLNKNYSTDVRFPVKFEYDSIKFVQATPLPKFIEINISSPGWDLVMKNFGFAVPSLQLPLTKPSVMKMVPVSTFWSMIVNQLQPLIVNYSITDTLDIFLQPRVKRAIALTVDLGTVSFEKNYNRITPVVISPHKVSFSGPEYLLSQLPNPYPISVFGTKLRKDFNKKILVPVPQSPFIQVAPEIVEIKFEVDMVVDVIKKIKISSSKMPWGIELSIDSIECKFLVPKSKLKEFDMGLFEVVLPIDYEQLKKGETKKILPKLKSFPYFAELISLDTIYIKKY